MVLWVLNVSIPLIYYILLKFLKEIVLKAQFIDKRVEMR